MEQLEKISTPAYKRCSTCGQIKSTIEFYNDSYNRDGLRSQCKVCRHNYDQSEGGKEAQRRYEQSERGKVVRMRKNCKYPHNHHQQSLEQGKKWRLEHPGYGKKWYYRLQDEINYHGDVSDFYPAYRMLKSLQEAEIVEIKV